RVMRSTRPIVPRAGRAHHDVTSETVRFRTDEHRTISIPPARALAVDCRLHAALQRLDDARGPERVTAPGARADRRADRLADRRGDSVGRALPPQFRNAGRY